MLAPGTRLGPYEILAPLGAGGMGEVYRAKDTRLGRDVAIKVLPEHLSANPDVRARFEREAKTVSSLSHPNICTLFDVGRAPAEGGSTEIDYLVMELIEGETLAARLRRGPLGGAELLRVGTQLADALDRAHRAGVIHRDLKPGNVMLTRSGAKLMDFGLARAADVAKRPGSGTSGSALTQSPTVGQALTSEGTIVGTYQYMAPEQLEGHEADARSDIWALGCVLYEMATGKRAFEGRSQATLIAAIIGSQPAPVAEAPSGAPAGDAPPAGLDRLVRACLAKDPEERVQTAHAAKQQLQWIAESAGLSGAGPAPSSASGAGVPAMAAGRPRRGPGAAPAWGVAALALLAGVAAVAWLWPRANAPRPAYRFRTEPVPGVSDYFWPRVSPDGRQLVFCCQDSTGTIEAWVRPMDQALARPIPGSRGLVRPYWSPDGREIAFVANGRIQRLAVSGGTPLVVCEARGGADLSWGSRGQILMDGQANDSLRVVPAAGGELQPATRIDRAGGEVGSAWPCFLPDGEHFLFIGSTRNAEGGGIIRLGRLGSLDSKSLGASDGRVEYAPGGWVLFLRGTTLLAQKLDLAAGKLTGQPLTLAENVRTGTSAGHFSVSPSGVLAYAHGNEAPRTTLHEVDRGGRRLDDGLVTAEMTNPALSPDGSRILTQRRNRQAEADEIWVRDLRRGTETKLAFGGGDYVNPQWSPDGRRFACVQLRPSSGAVVLVASADGLGARDTLSSPASGLPALNQWTAPGGKLLVNGPGFDGIFTADPDSAPGPMRRIAGLPGRMGHGAQSPDGLWLAYVTNEGGGAPQVYVQSLSGVPGRWQISTTLGVWPAWTKGGRELVFEGDGRLLAVDIDTRTGFHAGTPVRLFDLPLAAGPDRRNWTCSTDGQRFFVLEPPRVVASASDIEVVTDFGSLVNRR